MYEILPHTADIRIKATGASLEEFFVEMMRGMFAAAKVQPARNHAKENAKSREIQLTAPDKEVLLVDFLNEALYLGDTNKEIYEDAKFSKFAEKEVEGELVGRPRESVGVQVKAATYHGLKIEEKGGVYEATVIFDI